jgi:hypothetical protein
MTANQIGQKNRSLFWLWFPLLEYALSTGTVGAHLVGRCILYTYHFLDILIQ